MFAGIRIKQGWHENPNCEQFGYAFRKSVVLVSFDSRSAGKNCVTDDDFVLISHADIVTMVSAVPVSTESACHLVNFSPASAAEGAVCSTSEVVNVDIPCE